MYCTSFLLSLLVVAASSVVADNLDCSQIINDQTKPGMLNIRPNIECFFDSKVDNLLIQIDPLTQVDKGFIQIRKTDQEPQETFNYTAPFNRGYVITNFTPARIVFNLIRPSNDSIPVPFLSNVKNVKVPCRQRSEFDLLPTSFPQIGFECNDADTKSMGHIELIGASFSDSSLRHKLVNGSFSIHPLASRAVIKTAPAYGDCSQSHLNQEKFYLAPPEEVENFRCVNIFYLTDNQSHIDVSFKNFTDVLGPQDLLTIDDGDANNLLLIHKATESVYSNKTVSSKSKELAIIYNRPSLLDSPKKIFNLTVESRKAGGLVVLSETPIPLDFSRALNTVRFVLKAPPTKYVLIQLPTTIKLSDTNLTISNGDEILAQFENSFLPPRITSSKRGETLILESVSKHFDQLKDVKVSFVNSTCDKLNFGTGSFSIVGPLNECVWAITSKAEVGLKINYNNLTPDGCLSIISLDSGKSIYSKCNVSVSEVLPTFFVSKAVVSVKLPQNRTRLDGYLVTQPEPALIKLNQKPPFNITSLGYPVDYASSRQDISYSLTAVKKGYIVSIIDLDLRKGERLQINQKHIPSAGVDVQVPKNTTSVAIVAKANSLMDDYSNRRGFKLAVTSYDSIITANLTSSNITTSANVTSIYMLFSTEPGKIFNYTFNTAPNVEITTYDAKSIFGQRMKIDGLSTSNTMIFTYKTTKNQTIPSLMVNYTVVACNETSNHICDEKTRCVPYVSLCKGISFCEDGSDVKLSCNASGPIVPPKIIEVGLSNFSTFLLCLVMLAIGVCTTLYGPDLYKMVDSRLRGGQYSAFTSSE